MKIKTLYDPPPIPHRHYDWAAYDDETFSGEDGEPFGWGATEIAAIRDLLDQIEMKQENEK